MDTSDIPAEECTDDFCKEYEESLEADPSRSSRTYIMYHGTTSSAADQIMRNGFKRSKDGMLGPGVYVTRDFQKAKVYPLVLPWGERRIVLRLKVRVGKVKKIDRQGHPMQKTWHNYGFDSAWVPPNCGMVPSGREEDCVWDPKRIQVLDAAVVG